MQRQARANSNWGVLLAFLLVLLALAAVAVWHGVHQVPEGHVGLYWSGGALQNYYTQPGWHVMPPWVSVVIVQVTLQTDTVKDIPCGTSGGAMIYFDKIEVVNQLAPSSVLSTIRSYGVNYDRTWIFDKIHHEINQFCSSHTLQEVYIDLFSTLDEALSEALQRDCNKHKVGITVIAVRVTKPRIPEEVRNNYEQVEQQKTAFLVAQQEQLVTLKKEETKKAKARIEAEKQAEVALIDAQRESSVATIAAQKEANVSLIHLEMTIKEKQAEQKRRSIDDEIYVANQKAIAEANYYRTKLEAEANALMLTPEYLRLVLYQSLSNNTKIYFGEKIPQIFLDWAPDRSELLLKPSEQTPERGSGTPEKQAAPQKEAKKKAQTSEA
jgi:regulator of protease activity HflC (stomatin/prohibitin superfamily)